MRRGQCRWVGRCTHGCAHERTHARTHARLQRTNVMKIQQTTKRTSFAGVVVQMCITRGALVSLHFDSVARLDSCTRPCPVQKLHDAIETTGTSLLVIFRRHRRRQHEESVVAQMARAKKPVNAKNADAAPSRQCQQLCMRAAPDEHVRARECGSQYIGWARTGKVSPGQGQRRKK